MAKIYITLTAHRLFKEGLSWQQFDNYVDYVHEHISKRLPGHEYHIGQFLYYNNRPEFARIAIIPDDTALEADVRVVLSILYEDWLARLVCSPEVIQYYLKSSRWYSPGKKP